MEPYQQRIVQDIRHEYSELKDRAGLMMDLNIDPVKIRRVCEDIEHFRDRVQPVSTIKNSIHHLAIT